MRHKRVDMGRGHRGGGGKGDVDRGTDGDGERMKRWRKIGE